MKLLANQRERSGFTLIELLVVIAIIAILAAILFPVFARARDKARQASCLSNTKQLAQAVMMFTQDHDEFLPKASFNDVIDGPTGMTSNTGWDGAIYPYLKNVNVFSCPSDTVGRTYVGKSNTTPPGAKNPVQDLVVPTSYRINSSNQLGAFNPTNLSMLDRPADAILITESTTGVKEENYNQLSTWEGANQGFVCNAPGNVYTNNAAFDRHSPVPGRSVATWKAETPENLPGSNQGMSNYVFADGHAKAMTWGATWQRLGPDVTTQDGSKVVTPTMWRQLFTGTAGPAFYTDRCGYKIP
jgi:prepilin-type N-terminal cleavage/methylation domain-containing protein/prepilin-type processing-associated H-X9-DG protein